MAEHSNIILVGFMGTGKTRVGRCLAETLGMAFVDMDQEIERREGRSVADIFAQSGEPFFRSLERRLVRELSSRTGCVIATGGGVVLNPANIADFEASGMVVCLRASPETILQRVAADATRPLLACDDKGRRVRELLERRRPFYEAIPRQVTTDGLTPEQIAARVLQLYAAWTASRTARP